jgi:RHS repeat-associated protein
MSEPIADTEAPDSASFDGSEQQASGQGSARTPQPPAITLPKGGGAIRGIGEKFAANPVTGTGSISVPIATSPGRADFGPQLSLSYDSGAGNGPFGFGWSLSLPSVTRRTEKGLPTYVDADDSDVFILSEVEDLVPVFRQDRDGTWIAGHPGYRRAAEGFWVRDRDGRLVVHEDEHDGYRVRRYRPRVEGLFARIERWTSLAQPDDVHWRSISTDNVLTVYGLDPSSRIVDPLDASRVFRWLICETRDDKGNAVLYRYKAEDALGVDLGNAHERNRGPLADKRRTANRYLKRIHYGNTKPLLDDAGSRPRFLDTARVDEEIADGEWMFEVIVDYGDHAAVPGPNDDRARDAGGQPLYPWRRRADPFSVYRPGFEVRTARLCKRVLMFHHFPGEAGVGRDCLVRSTDFTYSADDDPTAAQLPVYTFLRRVTQTGYCRNDEGYDQRSLPPVQFEYTKPIVQTVVESVDPASLENLPIGLDGSDYRWTDLHGEGIPGLLTEQAGAWFYKRNLSPIPAKLADGRERVDARFGPLEAVALKPNVAVSSGAEFMDLAGDGHPDVVVMNGATPGLYEHDDAEGWLPFRPFGSRLTRALDDPNVRFVDLDGDGRADVLITESDALVWHPSLAEEGFGPARVVTQAPHEETGPRVVFADGTESISVADLSGDGLTDIVRIRNGEVCYWPNLGHGRFGAKVTMDNAPSFDDADRFDQTRIRLADIDGSGTTDILYLHPDGVRLYFNQSGNSWSEPQVVTVFPPVDDFASVVPTDLLGTGTSCLVWSSALPGDTRSPMRYVQLMGAQKPHLLVKIENNLGTTTEIEYAPSTKFYLQDREAGKPWITRLPFPVHVVERVRVTDRWRATKFSTTYSYHHGYFDGEEREFRGFGRVEQVDTEDYGTFAADNVESPYVTDDGTLYQPPVKTVTWFHNGACLAEGRVLSLYATEYFPHSLEASAPQAVAALGDFRENTLAEPSIANTDLTTDEWREALRACKGMALRQEIYELDADSLRLGRHEPVKLFSAACHTCRIQSVQPRDVNRHAVFLVTESEAITYHYELNLRRPEVADPRVSHTLNLRVDDLGNVLQSVSVGYPRFHPFVDDAAALEPGTVSLLREVQAELHLAYTETRYTDEDIDEPDTYRVRLPCETQTYELTGIRPSNAGPSPTAPSRGLPYVSIGELLAFRLSDRYQNSGTAVGLIQYHEQPDRSPQPRPQKRLVEHVRTLYFEDAGGTTVPTSPLPLGRHGSRGLKYEDYTLALTESLLTAIFGAKLSDSIVGSSARQKLAAATTSGYLGGSALAQQFGTTDTQGQYWVRSGVAGFAADAVGHFLLPERYIDPFGNETRISFDSRDLFIESTTSPRGNETRVLAFDFRVLAPKAVRDANGNVTSAAYDLLSMPVALAMETAGDSLSGLDTDALNPAAAELVKFFATAPYADRSPRSWLAQATTRFVYDFGEAVDANGAVTGWESRPAAACSIQRETHIGLLDGGQAKLNVAVEYSDGGGNVLVKKSQAEPDPASILANPPLRWIMSGKVILNNKAKVVKRYEPAFSETEHRFVPTEAEQEVGVTQIVYYDASGRLVRTEMPDGTFSRVEFSPWHFTSFDQSDTVLESRWYVDRGAPPPTTAPPPAPDRRAAWLAAHHANTPALTVLDSLGREVATVLHNRAPQNGVWLDEHHVTFTKLDGEGKPLWIRDARGNRVKQYIRPRPATRDPSNAIPPGAAPCYDIAGNRLFEAGMDDGERWTLANAAGKPMLVWDSNNRGPGSPSQKRLFYAEYDNERRPIRQWLTIDASAAALVETFLYCDAVQPSGAANLADARARNLIGRAVRHWNPSGLATVQRVDLSGNPAHVTRRFVRADADGGTGLVSWNVANRGSLLEAETFHQISQYDALGRETRVYNWHRDLTFGPGAAQSTPGATNRVAVSEREYNERGALATEWLHVRATKTTDATGRVSFSKDPQRSWQVITRVVYNAKGQKLSVELGNGTTTRYTYDANTFRLAHVYTRRRGSAFPNDCTSNTADNPRPQRPCGLQNLAYTYDSVGNITHAQDDAQQTLYFSNSLVEPSSEYTYDALYRLIAATGREHALQITPPRGRESRWPTGGLPSGDAVRTYTQRYRYDAVGNLVEVRHVPGSGSGWTRHYLTRPDSNRLDRTWYGTNTLAEVTYRHDTHGNMLNLNRTQPPIDPAEDWGLDIRWDWRDMIRAFDLGGGGLARYQYDIDKQRTRKRIARLGGVVEDRIYLGNYELYRRRNAQGAVVEEIEAVHVFDAEQQRVLLVDDVVRSGGMANPRPDGLRVAAQTLLRYQYGNHLGSASIELDDQAEIISYEEYHPHGTTAYRLLASRVEAPPKRYRYTGMERDEESGLSYHSARYLAPLIARWCSCDPLPPSRSRNAYAYANGNPIALRDPNGTDEERGFFYWFEQLMFPEVAQVRAAGDAYEAAGKQRTALLAAGNTGPESESRLKELDATMEANMAVLQGGVYQQAMQLQDQIERTANAMSAPTYGSPRSAPVLPIVRGKTSSSPAGQPPAKTVARPAPATPAQPAAPVAATPAPAPPAAPGALSAPKPGNFEPTQHAGSPDGILIRKLDPVAPTAKQVRGGSMNAGQTARPNQTLDPSKTQGNTTDAPLPEGTSVRSWKTQGREFDQEWLETFQYDAKQPAHVRGWLRNEARRVEQGQASQLRRPPGYVLGHAPGKRASEGYDYTNSTLVTTDINELETAAWPTYLKYLSTTNMCGTAP